MSETPALLPIGTIGKPHGVRGAVKATCADGFHDYLKSLPEVRVGTRTLKITEVGGLAGMPILSFEGVRDREGAEALRGQSLAADRSELPELGEEEFYHEDLVGLEVWAGTRNLGVVTDMRTLPSNSILAIELRDGGELLAPFTREAVPVVDVSGGRIEVDAAFLGIDD